MADEPEVPPVVLDLGAEPTTPKRRRRRMRVTAEDVEDILKNLQWAIDERDEWMQKRLVRYAKLRGWLEAKDWPWDSASNQHVPIMMANSLRVEAGLFNAALGMRPIMTPKVVRKNLKERAERANELIDYQIFMEADGEQRFERWITQFVQDGTVISHQPWVKDRRRVHDRRVLPLPPLPLTEFFAMYLPETYPGLTNLVLLDEDGYRWTAEVLDEDGDSQAVTFDAYDLNDDKLELIIGTEAIQHNGPAITVHDLEDIVVPMRSENCQPVSPENPFGSPWVGRLFRVSMDDVRRRMADGTYDLLTDEDLAVLAGEAITRDEPEMRSSESAMKEKKDAQTGLSGQISEEPEWVSGVEWYGPRLVGPGGLSDEVILTIFRDVKILARARYLTEQYPGVPIHRPFAEGRFIPVPGQFYGMGLPELMEGMHDMLHVLFNQNIDNGTLANQPFGFYRSSSGLKPEVLKLWPGELYPVDNPAQDVAFPNLPHADQTWSFNMIGVAMQFLEKLVQIGPLQFGQVPQGKASALRTVGTTMAILQQGAAMPEQILRRLFFGLKQIWEQFHLLNMRFLPRKKNFLIAGKPMEQDDAYAMIEDPEQLEIPIAFEPQPTILNTNKGLVGQALTGIGQAIFNPLAFQLGLVQPEHFYNWATDLIKASNLDPTRYIKKPIGTPEGPRTTFDEVLLSIMENRMPEIAPLEGAQQQLSKLQAFMQSDQIGLLTPPQVVLLKNYLQGLVEAVRLELQQQQMMQAAQQFADSMGQGGEGGAPSMGEPPPMQTEAPRSDELAGAEKGA